MISKRNFFTITMVMLVCAFLFQLTGGAKLVLSKFEINEYFTGSEPEEVTSKFVVRNNNRTNFISFYGNDPKLANMLGEYCYYQKKNLVRSHSVAEILTDNGRRNADMVCIQGSAITEKDLDGIDSLIKFGHRIAFLDLPDVEVIKSSQRLRDILGIVQVYEDETHLNGIHLNKSFLIGGEQFYEALTPEAEKQQDLELDVPWYVVGSGCTMYMNGILPEEIKQRIQPGFYPAIIWSRHLGEATIFAVEGDYMRDLSGIGILSSLEACANDFTVYPVVNAECLVFENYPTFANENTEKLQELYSRNAQNVERDLIWPGLAAVVNDTDFVPSYTTSAYITDKNAERMDKDAVDAFFQLIREQHGEVGYAVGRNQDIQANLDFFTTYLPTYRFQYACAQNETEAATGSLLGEAGDNRFATILINKDASTHLVDAEDDGFIGLSAVNDASVHTFSDDIRERSILTALGYLMIAEDMSNVIYPRDEDDEWQNKFESLASNIETYYKPLKGFDHVTLSEAGNRARSYLNSRVSGTRHGFKLILLTNASKRQPRFCILRTPGKEITDIEGATYDEIEEDIYLLTVTEEHVNITWEYRKAKKD